MGRASGAMCRSFCDSWLEGGDNATHKKPLTRSRSARNGCLYAAWRACFKPRGTGSTLPSTVPRQINLIYFRGEFRIAKRILS